MFPRMIKGKSTTRLVLKKPKTETSIRKIWLPKTLAYILRDWKERQEKLKEFMGDEYVDYNLEPIPKLTIDMYEFTPNNDSAGKMNEG